MKLFHGSNMMIDKVDLSKSKLYKDFGQAFYLSAEKEQAQKMAEAKVVQFGGDKSITEFEFDESYMANNKLEVKIFTGYSHIRLKNMIFLHGRKKKGGTAPQWESYGLSEHFSAVLIGI